MAIIDLKCCAEKYSLVSRPLRNQRGAAIIIALIISAAVLAVSSGVLEFSTRSTEISGAGKSYRTVAEAADGSIRVIQDAINYRVNGDSSIDTDVIDDSGSCFDSALITTGNSCDLALELPNSLGGHYTATVTLEKLYSQVKVGGRLEFPPSSGGSGNDLATYFRISALAVGPKNVRAEKTVLYRLGD